MKMGKISTTISIEENVSSAFKSMHTAANTALNTFRNFNDEINISGTRAELAYKAELNTLKQVEQEAQKIIATQGTQTAQAQDIIESVYEERKYVEQLRREYENVNGEIKDNQKAQEQFNQTLNTGNTAAVGLHKTISSLVKTYLGIASIKKTANFIFTSPYCGFDV